MLSKRPGGKSSNGAWRPFFVRRGGQNSMQSPNGSFLHGTLSEPPSFLSMRHFAWHALGPSNGSRAMIDALHHLAWRIRKQNVQAGKQLLEEERLDKDEGLLTSLTAVLEVLPVSSRFTGIEEEAGPV